jgi:D-tyrosyl-tRNA(Tyr) deacylase
VKAVLQRVTQASVSVEGQTLGRIGLGWLVLLGIAHDDTEATAVAMADKAAGLRCFEDSTGKTNLSAADVGAAWLVVSQFTLLADVARGRRPGFSNAAPPRLAEAVVRRFGVRLSELGFQVEEGRFGAHMQVSLVNDGPFTILLESPIER